MKKITFLAASALLTMGMIACGGGEKKEEKKEAAPATETVEAEMKTVTVDPAASTVEWKGTMVGVYSHSGTVALKEAKLDWKGNDIVGGNFVVDMTTINPTDSAYTEENTPEKLVGHLGTGDFFAVEENPTASFEITGSDMAAGTVSGNLTIRGNTNAETVSNVTVDESTGAISGNLTFNRQDYDVAYKAMKDMVLADDIELNIMLKPAM